MFSYGIIIFFFKRLNQGELLTEVEHVVTVELVPLLALPVQLEFVTLLLPVQFPDPYPADVLLLLVLLLQMLTFLLAVTHVVWFIMSHLVTSIHVPLKYSPVLTMWRFTLSSSGEESLKTSYDRPTLLTLVLLTQKGARTYEKMLEGNF